MLLYLYLKKNQSNRRLNKQRWPTNMDLLMTALNDDNEKRMTKSGAKDSRKKNVKANSRRLWLRAIIQDHSGISSFPFFFSWISTEKYIAKQAKREKEGGSFECLPKRYMAHLAAQYVPLEIPSRELNVAKKESTWRNSVFSRMRPVLS